MFYPSEPVKFKVETAPLFPGVYIYRDKQNEILYVGKAVVLRNRLRSYFQNFERIDPKIQIMIKQINDVEYHTTDTEVEALILETNLIKKYQPKYNSMMKDDKSYVWLMITKNTDFPKVEVVREKKIKNADYFGPFPAKTPVDRTLKRLRSIFNYRTCNRKIEEVVENGKTVIKSSDPKPCLYFYLGQCSAPCAGNITKKEYSDSLRQIRRFFKSEKEEILNELKEEMKKYAEDQDFEKAASLRDKIRDVEYVTQKIKVDKDEDEFSLMVKKEEEVSNGLTSLVEKLKIENLQVHKDFKIEGYDISNIQGKNAVASMVVCLNGKPDKNLYRKFKIKTKESPDDFEMMREVFKRRLSHKGKDNDESFNVLPDLIMVDGGKGQLSAAYQVLTTMKVDIPVIGLAKREEEVFKIIEEGGELKFKKVTINRKSQASYVLQNLRDEAHRFGLGYHRKLRSKAQLKSQLDDIPGIGKITKLNLLRAFGNVDAIKKASKDELLGVVKNKSTVEKIKKLL